jgi:cysteine-rich repeat protein
MRACIGALLALACIPAGTYACADDAACGAGTCEVTGFCSRPDRACPSGRRYSDLAGDGLADRCVDANPPDTSSDDASALSDGESSHASTEPVRVVPECGDGIVEPGEACDEPDDVVGDGCNPDCRASGSVRWHASLAGVAGGRDQALGLALLGSGDIVAVGSEEIADGTTDMIAVRLSHADGALAWTWRRGGDAQDDDVLAAVAVNAAGHIVIGGTEVTAAQGPRAWVGVLDGAGKLARAVLPDALAVHDLVGDAGGFVLVGTDATVDEEGRAVAYREDADVPEWSALSAVPGNDGYAAAVRVGLDDVFVAGNTAQDGSRTSTACRGWPATNAPATSCWRASTPPPSPTMPGSRASPPPAPRCGSGSMPRSRWRSTKSSRMSSWIRRATSWSSGFAPATTRMRTRLASPPTAPSGGPRRSSSPATRWRARSGSTPMATR